MRVIRRCSEARPDLTPPPPRRPSVNRHDALFSALLRAPELFRAKRPSSVREKTPPIRRARIQNLQLYRCCCCRRRRYLIYIYLYLYIYVR